MDCAVISYTRLFAYIINYYITEILFSGLGCSDYFVD